MSTEIRDYVVLGAGPGGLQTAYFLQRAGRDYVVLEEADHPGDFFTRFPRHRRLISINKVHTGSADAEFNLRFDWNSLLADGEGPHFREHSLDYFPNADRMVEYLDRYERTHMLAVRYGIRIRQIRRNGLFELEDTYGQVYRCRRLIIAAGFSRTYLPEIPGIEAAEPYATLSVDPSGYTGQRVLILGKGNSAFETANALGSATAAIHLCSPRSVRLAWQTHYVGHLRAVNNDFLDTYQLKSQNAVIDGACERIERDGKRLLAHIAYSHAGGEREVISYDRVLACTGFRFDPSLFDTSCSPDVSPDGRFPLLTETWQSVNVPDLFFAGNLMHGRDYGKTMSGFIHGFRYNIRTLVEFLGVRYHGASWSSRKLVCDVENVSRAILDRCNRSSALFLQPGYLCDVIGLHGKHAAVYEGTSRDIASTCQVLPASDYLATSLEYGRFGDDIFGQEREPAPGPIPSAYLHPVVRRYSGSALLAEYHLRDDLENRWDREEDRAGLTHFLDEYLRRPAPAATNIRPRAEVGSQGD